ncbi:alpha/beta fold hydrolase [Pseudonocardia humida]|uniref:Alpha/beta hydrolase n=1 Tax=Pseudonocardia humida TaxID=2800819 RepID=A0ABT1A4N6_9PSEU|nr:alpha/beta hydrolase [Pseudonocardia humida]MCO1657794.1 alpha/beta hydrolase [Pseudonocardia humida]
MRAVRVPRRVRRFLVGGLAVLVGVPVLAVAALLVWDGGVDTGPRRELLPGVQLDLRTAQTRLGPVEYDLAGADGPVVLSVHAGAGGADQARLFADWLRPAGYRILSPSRPGYLGTPLDSGRTLEEQADLLVALLDELGVDRVGVFAASAGAPVAYAFAARHPDRVWGLVAVGGTSRSKPPGGPSSPVRAVFMSTVGQKLVRLTAELSPRTVLAGTLDETSTFTDEQKAARTAYVMDTPPVREFFAAMLGTTFPYAERRPGTANDAELARAPLPLDRITAPTLVVHGTRDGDVPFADGEHAAATIPGAEHLWLPDDDHLGFWLGPSAASARSAVGAFLDVHRP